ncbi:MAG: UDP-glucuronic acid decarboxylase family protein [Candidatus Methylomirabilis sp.]
MPRSLVTGGAGFLGSHLCDRLLAEGHEVLCLDTLLTGRLENIGHVMDHRNFTFIQSDITKPIEVEGPLDYILHFASPASPKDYERHPIHTLKVGALGTYHALGLAKAKGATMLLASSSEVYGDPEVNPQPESYWGRVNPVGPRSVYDEAKRYAEAITMAYHHTHHLEVRIARIFNTYGPRMRLHDGRALPNFIAQSLAGEPLTVYGDGSQTRSFCYVDDLIEGVYRLLTYQLNEPNKPNEPLIFNLGNPDEVTILQLAREIIDVTGSRSQIVFEPLPLDDPKVRRPDITRAKDRLGWEPRVSRFEGLKQTIAYFEAALLGSRGN